MKTVANRFVNMIYFRCTRACIDIEAMEDVWSQQTNTDAHNPRGIHV